MIHDGSGYKTAPRVVIEKPGFGDGIRAEGTSTLGIGGSIRALSKTIIQKNKYPLDVLHGFKYKVSHEEDLFEAIIDSNTTNDLKKLGINSVAIMPNDTDNYPDDSFENMKILSKEAAFDFPYLIDETQNIAKKYGAVCTPDFFGYNSDLELQYRGRLRALKDLTPIQESENELLKAMIAVSNTGKGPQQQNPSMGCNIKWK